jgi:hypothetical protein
MSGGERLSDMLDGRLASTSRSLASTRADTVDERVTES